MNYRRKILVAVSKRDIRDGRKNIRHSERCSTHCPIALAINRETYFWPVRVYYRHADLAGLTARLPKVATRFIAALEEGRPVKPFSFWIHALDT